MSRLSSAKKKMGRPAVDSEAVNVRIERRSLSVLDEWIEKQPDPKPTRPEAIRIALRDWLTGLGLLKATDEREDRH